MIFDIVLLFVVAPSAFAAAFYLFTISRSDGISTKLARRVEQRDLEVRNLRNENFQLRHDNEEQRKLADHIGPQLKGQLIKLDKNEIGSLLGVIDHQSLATTQNVLASHFDQRKGARQFYDFCVASNSLENECTKLLAENLWLLLPEFTQESKFYVNQSVRTVADALFPSEKFNRTNPSSWKFQSFDKRPDGVGLFIRNARNTFGPEVRQKSLVILEAKRNDKAVNQYVMDEALNYAINLRKLVPDLNGWDIECLAIAGSVKPEIKRRTYQFADVAGTIIVTPMTWTEIADRGMRVNPLLLNAFQHQSPVVDKNYEFETDADEGDDPQATDLQTRESIAELGKVSVSEA